MVLLVSHDLNRHERPGAYQKIAEIIQNRARSVYRPLYSQWCVETDHSPAQWYEFLKPALDRDDGLFIVEIRRGSYYGWLSRDVWEWLELRV